MIINNVQIGSDIEWPVRNKTTGEFISAEGLIQGTKDEPFRFDKNNRWFATSLDNVLAEGNIPPCNSAYQFYKNVEKLRNYINSTLPENVETVATAAIRLDFKYLQTENARMYGCNISYNCWTGEIVQPEAREEDNLRAAGTHIHVGYDYPSEGTNFAIAKAADLFLNIPSILVEPENERKKSGYGSAGNCRHQPHGLEVRGLSSYFSGSKELLQWCFRNTKAAIKFVNDEKIHLIEGMGELIQNTINKEDRTEALKLIKHFKIRLPNVPIPSY